MNKKFKKLFTLATSLVASLGIGCVSYAATIDHTGKAETPTGDNTITIARELELNSSSGGTVYAPNITYTYELSAGDATTEGDIEIKAGDVSYLATGSRATVRSEYTNSDSATSGNKVNKPISFTFNPDAFPSAGIYRYKLNETATSVNPTSIGITRDKNYVTVKYLDVYVTNGDTAGEKKITGYVLWNSIDPSIDPQDKKSPGWSEVYNVYTLQITKNITGALADKTAEFPFKVTLNGQLSSAKLDTDGTLNVGSSTTPYTVTGNLGDNGTMYISGIPTTVTFDIGEKNPTADVYKATATARGIDTGATLERNKSIDKNTADYVAVVEGAAKTTIDANALITVTNELDSPSPTGVILYFAPYILIGGLAVLLLVISVKSKKRVQA